MQIIKRGELPENRVYQTVCRHCKTVFQFARSEAKMGVRDPRDGMQLMTVECPLPGCEKECYVAA